jgi:hypothetical protein
MKLENQQVVFQLGGLFIQSDTKMSLQPQKEDGSNIGICFTQASGDSKCKGVA